MRIFLVAYEFPYPPNHGGKADVWKRLKGLKKCGANIFMLTWYNIRRDELPNREEILEVEKTVDELVMVKVPRNLKRVWRTLGNPSLVAARILSATEFAEILEKVRAFAPEFVLIDGLYGGRTGIRFAKSLGVPVALRSHNIEHRYMAGQYKMAESLRSALSIVANLKGLRAYEYEIFSSVDAYFDISMEDIKFWTDEGFENGYWLPPVQPDNKVISENLSEITDDKYHIGFAGNLHTPNNVNGLFWFLDEVLPKVMENIPEVEVLLVGSRPSDELTERCATLKNITLTADPQEIEPHLKTVKMLINPVRFGSGVNIKAIDFLFTDKQVVTTSVGVKGLPKSIEDVFFIADSVEDFTAQIIAILCHKQGKEHAPRVAFREYFNETEVEKIMNVMHPICQITGLVP